MTPWASAYLAIDGGLTVIDAGARDARWAQRVLAERPETRLHRMARHELAPIGALDEACTARAIRHVNYLRIADAEIALPVLLGARRLLRHARVDIIEMAGPAPTIGWAATLLASFDF